MTRMMMMATTMTTTGGSTKMPNGVRDKFEPPLKRDKAEFGPSGVVTSPLLGSGLARGGGSWNANNGAGQSLQS
jgi:hypothetical protein